MSPRTGTLMAVAWVLTLGLAFVSLPAAFAVAMLLWAATALERPRTGVRAVPMPPRKTDPVPALRAQNAALNQALELQGQALANVSHELRTPLAAITGYCAMLAEDLGDAATPSQKTHLETITRNTSLLLSLINSMLDLSRIQAGKLEMTWTRLLVGECLESALDFVEPQMKAKGLAFEVNLPDHPVEVQGSFDRLRQVLVNLLSNAVKFTERGTIGVNVREDGDRVEIEVWDSGIGIPPDQLPHVFEEFRQADGSIRRKYGGSGLGLAISRSIVGLHQGTIEAFNRPEGGTRMVIRLPALRRRSKP